jgi:hypothetical protein
MRTISVEERRRRLGRRHFLSEPAGTVEKVAGDLVGLHSSDPVTVYLSARARVAGLSPQDVEKAIYEERSLLRMLGMRRTLFVVPVHLAPELKAACSDGYVAPERRRLVGYLEDQIVQGDGSAWLDAVIEKTLVALIRSGHLRPFDPGPLLPGHRPPHCSRPSDRHVEVLPIPVDTHGTLGTRWDGRARTRESSRTFGTALVADIWARHLR